MVAAYAARHVLTEHRITPPPTAPVAGYSAWWDATQITGIADGAALATWPDASGNGYPFTAAAGHQPTYYKTTAGKLIHGNPAVWFDGSTTVMHAAVPSTAQPNTLTVRRRLHRDQRQLRRPVQRHRRPGGHLRP